jgi:2-amino-4-hydroxy-6-hydroxymethyldihydropteridine diphosphokinase
MDWVPAYIGVGSNLDEPAGQVRRALSALEGLARTRLISRSALYLSTPLGSVAQPDFVNAVAALLTQQDVWQLFRALRSLEIELGRLPPRVRWGPRRIDLDLLLFGRQRVDSPELTVPHPGIVQRNFVLYPLLEVAPELDVPGAGRVAELVARVDSTGIRRLKDEPTTHGA